MLTPAELATIRAALSYWQEEMGPHGAGAMQSYYDDPSSVPLEGNELSELRSKLAGVELGYAIYDLARSRFSHARLFHSLEEAQQHLNVKEKVVAAFLPYPRPGSTGTTVPPSIR